MTALLIRQKDGSLSGIGLPVYSHAEYGARDGAYPVPAGAVFVSTTGNDSTGSGTLAAPYASIKKALSVTAAGGTVVVRGGSYHEGGTQVSGLGNGFTFPASNITLQPYPGEEVWFDGSVVVTGWASYDSGKWRAPFAHTLDRAPTQVRGETSSSYGSFIMSTYPIAHWPEMVLLDGVPLTQVRTLAEVGPGKFFVEGSYPNSSGTNRNMFASTAYVIGDNPAGKEVRIAKLSRAGSSSRSGTRIRGIGFRRYANTMPDFGCLYIDAAGVTIENCTFEDMSDYAVHLTGLAPVIRRNTFRRIGRKGVGLNYADGGLVEWNLFQQTNFRRFNYGPDGGAIKVGRSWDLTIRTNRFIDNRGHGVWYDESCYRGKVHGNWFTGNYGTGVLYEIGDSALIVDNIFVDNGIYSTDTPSGRRPHNCPAIDIKGSNRCRAWFNTIINAERGVMFSQGWRFPFGEGSFGRDPRQPASFYESDMTWDFRSGEFCNNAIIGAAGIDQVQSSMMAFYDENNVKSSSEFGVKFEGNLYARPDGTHPARFVLGWKSPAGQTVVYFTPTGAPYNDTVPWNTATGDKGSRWATVTAPFTSRPVGALSALALAGTTPAAPIPSDVRALLDVSPFTRQPLGAGFSKE
ncbi:right-handed parallel beta-helix repeat-containing protein [Microbacterium sp.]|uniref:right-handed parallel beta-helix repeat-containing protein n=1 Tax=Microbacterium sp. TaxID=51671 RepID=UPI0039E6F883